MDINTSSKILMDNILLMQKCDNEIKSLLQNIEDLIKSKLTNIRNLEYDQSIQAIKELFDIQEDIAFIVFRFEYPVNDFLYDFICDFDRYDAYSVQYIMKKYVSCH